ncbi:MAG: hypothetical protein ACLQU4_06700, partial [Limisphaerales bacterium]
KPLTSANQIYHAPTLSAYSNRHFHPVPLSTARIASRPRRRSQIWHAAIDYLVPIGYEDETGFHYGEMPTSNTAMSLAINLP